MPLGLICWLFALIGSACTGKNTITRETEQLFLVSLNRAGASGDVRVPFRLGCLSECWISYHKTLQLTSPSCTCQAAAFSVLLSGCKPCSSTQFASSIWVSALAYSSMVLILFISICSDSSIRTLPVCWGDIFVSDQMPFTDISGQ